MGQVLKGKAGHLYTQEADRGNGRDTDEAGRPFYRPPPG